MVVTLSMLLGMVTLSLLLGMLILSLLLGIVALSRLLEMHYFVPVFSWTLRSWAASGGR